VGAGTNSTTLHCSSNDAVMKAGEVVVIDAAAECSMYASDITRTMPVGGKFTARQKEIYDIVLGAQRAAAAFVAGKMKMGNLTERGPEVTDSLDKVAYDCMASRSTREWCSRSRPLRVKRLRASNEQTERPDTQA